MGGQTSPLLLFLVLAATLSSCHGQAQPEQTYQPANYFDDAYHKLDSAEFRLTVARVGAENAPKHFASEDERRDFNERLLAYERRLRAEGLAGEEKDAEQGELDVRGVELRARDEREGGEKGEDAREAERREQDVREAEQRAREAREAEQRARDARVAEQREREAREAEERAKEAREAEEREQDTREAEQRAEAAREAEKRAREAREAREAEERAWAAREAEQKAPEEQRGTGVGARQECAFAETDVQVYQMRRIQNKNYNCIGTLKVKTCFGTSVGPMVWSPESTIYHCGNDVEDPVNYFVERPQRCFCPRPAC